MRRRSWGKCCKLDVTEKIGTERTVILTALPKVYYSKDSEFWCFQGPRSKKDFINLTLEKEWRSIKLFHRGSMVLMRSVSELFWPCVYTRTCSHTVLILAVLPIGLILGLCTALWQIAFVFQKVQTTAILLKNITTRICSTFVKHRGGTKS
jgi:hypothetical protein